MTSASVVGPDTRFEAPCLAIKRAHILAVQAMDHEAPELVAVSESSETGD